MLELAFRKLGEGPPLIILHGLYGSGRNWLSFARSVSERYTVYLLDLRNHGKSPHTSSCTYGEMAQDVMGLVAREITEPFYLLGHSMGGKVALQCLKMGLTPEKLVLVDIAPRKYPPDYHRSLLERLLALDLSQYQERTALDSALEEAIPQPHIRQFLMTNLRRTAEKHFYWQCNLSALSASIEEITRSPVLTAEQVFETCPLLVLKGGLSPYVEPQDIMAYASCFPQLQLETFPTAGHWLHADVPEAFKRAVLYFLTKE